MDQGRDKSKPPSTSYRETFRRHRKLFCMPIILGALAAAFIVFATGRTYKSTASLWVDTTPPLPSSVGANTNSLAEPPASAEQGVLTELLSTRAFAASVAKTSLLGKSVDSADAAETQLQNGQVASTVPGGQVLQISYSASSPAMSESVLGAVIAQLRNYTNRLTAQHQVRGAHNNWSVQVIDAPSQASTAPLRKSKIAEVILAGALGGLLVSFLAVVALTPAKKEEWEDELPIGGPFVPNVPPGEPFASPGVPAAPAQAAPTATAAAHSRLSLGDRRFQFQTRSGPTEEQ